MGDLVSKGWFEDSPKDWDVFRMKNIMNPKEGRSETGEEELLSVTINRGVVKRTEYLEDEEGGSRSETLVGYKLVEPEDLVNNIMKMSFRCLGVSQHSGIVSPAYSVFELHQHRVSPKFINYLLRTDRYVFEYRKLSKGIQESRMRLYDDFFLSMKVIVPPLEQQQLISRYLDKKTEQIDSLIDKIQKKIELFKEQRTSLINQCVTKGLDPNVEMKDSGVEWIGEIPSQWKSLPLKRTLKEYFGGSWGEEPVDDQTENIVRVIRVTEFDWEKLVVSKDIPTKRSLKLEGNSKKTVRNGDLIIEKSGGGEKTPVGRVVLVDEDFCQLTVNSNFTNLLRPNQDLLDPKFGVYLLYSSYTGGGTVRNIKQTTGIQNLDMEGFLSDVVFIPPLTEQRRIWEFLDQSTEQSLTLIEKNLRKIYLLREYRQSLISSVVTGKVLVTEDMV